MSEIYGTSDPAVGPGYYSGEVSGDNNRGGVSGWVKDKCGFNENAMKQQDLETQAMGQHMSISRDTAQMQVHAGYSATDQSMQLTGAKTRASDALYGNMSVEQEAMRQSMEFRREIMSDDSIPHDEKVKLLGELTQQMRAGDNFRTNGMSQSTIGGASHGTFQKGITDTGMNSMSMDEIAGGQAAMMNGQASALQGQGNAFSGLGTGYANGTINGGGFGLGGLGGFGLGGLGLGGGLAPGAASSPPAGASATEPHAPNTSAPTTEAPAPLPEAKQSGFALEIPSGTVKEE